MIQAVDYQEFSAFREEVRREREENEFYRSVVCGLVWLNRRQAGVVLGVSDSTMHRLIKSNRIAYRPEGNRQLFSIPDLMAYLTAQKIDVVISRQRIMAVANPV